MSCFGGKAVLRLRARQRADVSDVGRRTTVLMPERPTPAAMFALLQQHQPTIFYGVPTLYAAMLGATRQGRAGRHRAAPVRSAGEALPERSATVDGALRRRDPRRHRLDGDAAHLPVQPARRCATAPPARRCPATRCASSTTRARRAGRRGRRTLVAGPPPPMATGTSATKAGEPSRALDQHRRQVHARRRRLLRLLWPQRRHVQGLRHLGIAIRGRGALITHAAVLEAAVVPKQDPDGLLKPKAYIVLKPDTQGRHGLPSTEGARQAAGRHVEISALDRVVESLPKTATGKIQRFKLREHD